MKLQQPACLCLLSSCINEVPSIFSIFSSKLWHLYPPLPCCQSTCPPFMEMNKSALLVLEPPCWSWPRLPLLTSVALFLKLFPASFSFFPLSFALFFEAACCWGLSRHIPTDFISVGGQTCQTTSPSMTLSTQLECLHP